MKSIKEFGFDDPIGVWKNIIVEGHGRLIAAKRLGIMEKMGCTYEQDRMEITNTSTV